MLLFLISAFAFAGNPTTPPETALTLEEIEAKKEEKRRASLPYDCFAGVCLNAPASIIPPRAVRISDHTFMRTVETCKGKVVKITAAASWNDFVSERAVKGATTLYNYETNGENSPYDLCRTITQGLETLGWVSTNSRSYWSSPKVRGERELEVEDFMNYNDVIVRISSEHPNREELCAYKATQGL